VVITKRSQSPGGGHSEKAAGWSLSATDRHLHSGGISIRVADEDIQFPVNGVDLEFQVGITRSAEATAGIRLWVIDVGGKGGYESQSAHTVKVSLGAPVNQQGETIKVTRSASYKP